MAKIKLQNETEKKKDIYYIVDIDDRPIGEGGMGKVYKGFSVNERNGVTYPVAIKFMFDGLPHNAYERARREAEIQLRNDNLVEMLGFIETKDILPTGEVRKHYHVVSELLTGVSLYDILEGKTKDRNGEDVPFAVKMLQDYQNDPEHFAQIVVMNVLSGLMALHDAGYIHRDIDPSNIMLTSDGHIKLIDFGIAKQMNNLTTGDKSLTVAGKFMGKPEYAAPELALGDISHQNQTTDIYAVGILLYQCIIGHTPFEGARHEVLEMQIRGKMPLNKIKNRALRNIIATACQKKQELRYQTSSQMRVALENMNGVQRNISSTKKWGMIGTTVAIIILITSIVLITSQRQKRANEEAEIQRIEQQKTNELINTIIAKIEEADKLKDEGMSKESDDYEKKLIDAYKTYAEVEVIAKNNELTNTDISMSEVSGKKSDILQTLNSSIEEFKGQAVELTTIGEVELAETYTNRANAIEVFLNSITTNQEFK